jgi:hypothetical protein
VPLVAAFSSRYAHSCSNLCEHISHSTRY